MKIAVFLVCMLIASVVKADEFDTLRDQTMDSILKDQQAAIVATLAIPPDAYVRIDPAVLKKLDDIRWRLFKLERMVKRLEKTCGASSKK